MKKLQLIVYVFFAIAMIIVYSYGGDNYYKQKSLACADYFNQNDFSGENPLYNQFLYFEENRKSDTSAEVRRVCCRYVLINNSIKERCENGR